MSERKRIETDPLAISPTYLHLYIKGNAMWPQKHFSHPLLIAEEALRANDNLEDLVARHFSQAQLMEVSGAMNKLHNFNKIDKVYEPDHDVPPSMTVSSDDITKLWNRGVVEGANWTKSLAIIVPELEVEVAQFPDFRQVYREDKLKAKKLIGHLDQLLAYFPNAKTELSILFTQIVQIFDAGEFKHLAHMYRMASSLAHNEETKLLIIDGKSITKTQATQSAADLLIEKLTQSNPQYDWNKFHYQY